MISEERPMPFGKALRDSEEKSKNGGRHLLLGNGFSIGYSETFHYRNLFEQGVSETDHASVRELARLKEEYDFERLMKFFMHGKDVLHCLKEEYKKENGQSCGKHNFGLSPIFVAQQMPQLLEKLELKIDKIIEDIRDIFLRALVKTHPKKFCPSNPEKVTKFLDHFDTLYTVNYDMLSYWSIIEYIKNRGTNTRRFDDGFRRYKDEEVLAWLQPDDTNVWYLHGALHLFYDSKSNELIKIKSKKDCEDGWQSLIDQISERINKKEFPLVVLEGSWERKLEKIKHDFYLWEGYRSLKRLSGVLFTFGMSFGEDDHILKAIEESKISTVYVGIYKPNREDSDFPKIRCKVEMLLKTKDVKFYRTGK
jgi:hypothetical protein